MPGRPEIVRQKFSALLLAATYLFFCSCNGKIPAFDPLPQESNMQARAVMPPTFLEHRLKNRIKKIQGHVYELLYEDENFLYYGYTEYQDGKRYAQLQQRRDNL